MELWTQIRPGTLILILSGLIFNLSLGQQITPPVSPELPSYTFENNHPNSLKWFFLTPFRIYRTGNYPAPNAPKLLLLNPEGFVKWYGHFPNSLGITDFRYHPNHQRYTFIEYVNANQVFYHTLDRNFDLINSVSPVNARGDSHAFWLNSQGEKVISATRDTFFDLSSFLIDGNPGSSNQSVRCFVIQRVDDNNNLLWEWNSCDHLHPTEAYTFYGYGSGTWDYCHGNAIFEDTDGNYLVSFRHLNSVVKIDAQSGQVIWRLGGKNSDFSFVNDGGFSGQHRGIRMQNGWIGVYDNGNMGNPQVSRGVCYELDSSLGMAVKTWEFSGSAQPFGPGMGNFEAADGDYLINYGEVYRPVPTFEVVDSGGNVMQTLSFADSIQTYRTHWGEPANLPAGPAVTCVDSLGATWLVAEAGHSDYLWSDGAVSQSILGVVGQTYQVWVPQGVGRLASAPVEVEPGGGCRVVVGLEEPLEGAPPKRVGWFDVLGRSWERPTGPGLWIERFSDGTAKKVWLDK